MWEVLPDSRGNKELAVHPVERDDLAHAERLGNPGAGPAVDRQGTARAVRFVTLSR